MNKRHPLTVIEVKLSALNCSWQRIRLVAVFQLKERTMSYCGTSLSFSSKIFISSITNSLFFFLVMHAQDSSWPLLVFTQWIFTARKACCIKICIRVKRTSEAAVSSTVDSIPVAPSTGHCYDGISCPVIAFLTTDSRPASRRPRLSLKRTSSLGLLFNPFLNARPTYFNPLSWLFKSFHEKIESECISYFNLL